MQPNAQEEEKQHQQRMGNGSNGQTYTMNGGICIGGNICFGGNHTVHNVCFINLYLFYCNFTCLLIKKK